MYPFPFLTTANEQVDLYGKWQPKFGGEVLLARNEDTIAESQVISYKSFSSSSLIKLYLIK